MKSAIKYRNKRVNSHFRFSTVYRYGHLRMVCLVHLCESLNVGEHPEMGAPIFLPLP